MNKQTSAAIMAVVLVAVVVQGFRLATQSGLAGIAGSMQNDGYAVTGGLMILAGGLGLGYLAAKWRHK